jgi:hypothetical protein
VKWDAVLRWLVLLTVFAGIAGLGLVSVFWGREVWGGPALGWPGGPYGLAATTGLLVPFAIASLVVTLTRVKWREDKGNKGRSLKWIAASLPGQFLTSLLSVALFAAMRPRRGRDADCYSEGGPCWLREQYPYLWAVIWGAALLTGSLLVDGHFLYRRRRTVSAESDSDFPVQPAT